MGIIQRQSLKNTVVRFIGTAISVLATFFIYSKYKEIYGLYSFLMSGALVLSPLILMGGGSVSTKFHPQNSSRNFDHLLSWLLLLSVAGLILVLALSLIFQEPLARFFLQEQTDPLIQAYIVMVIPLAFLLSIKSLLGNYISNYKRIVVPQLLDDTTMRFVVPILVLSAGVGWITMDRYITLLMLLLAIISALLFIYLRKFEPIQLRIPTFLKNPLQRRQILLFGGFALLSSFGSILTTRIDTLMVGKMIDLTNAGAYAILLFLTNLVLIPKQSIFMISAPILARHMDHQEYEETRTLYRSSSIILLIAGLFISGMIMLNIRDIISIMPKNEEFTGFMAVSLALCVTQVVDMTLSMNQQILIYSKYYWVNLILFLALSVCNILFNLYLIPRYGLSGAAFSTLFSVSLLGVFGLAITYGLFRIHPFTRNTFFVILLAGMAFYATGFVDTGNAFGNLFAKSALYGMLFGVPLYALKLSQDFNRMVRIPLQWIR